MGSLVFIHHPPIVIGVRVCNVNIYLQPFDSYVYEQITAATRVLYRRSCLIKCIDLIFLKSIIFLHPPPQILVRNEV